MGQNATKEEKEVMEHYNLRKSDLKSIKQSFQQYCKGKRKTLTKEEFRKVYGSMFPGNANQFADEMFRSFDIDGDQEVDFIEFVKSLCMCDSKNVEEKIDIAFRLYDKNGDGTIGINEVETLFEAYSNLVSVKVTRGKSAIELAQEFFDEMDVNHDREVSFDEFRSAARRNSTILSILNPKPPEWE